ncbi:MAG: YitT family protein [Oscillospiraceae bacterium]
MSVKETVKRYVFFVVGLFVNAFGISFITKAGLGTSPISSLPYVLSLAFPPTLGIFTFIINMLLIAVQVILLKKDFQKIQLLQIPIMVVFSSFIDLTMHMLSHFQPQGYIWQFASLLVGCAILGLGVSMEVMANVVMLSGEATVNALVKVTGKNFGNMKIAVDSTLVTIAIITSLIIFHGLQGVREGTVISALLVGTCSKFYLKHIGGITKIFDDDFKIKA